MNTPGRGIFLSNRTELRETLDMFLRSGGFQVSVLCLTAIGAAYVMYIFTRHEINLLFRGPSLLILIMRHYESFIAIVIVPDLSRRDVSDVSALFLARSANVFRSWNRIIKLWRRSTPRIISTAGISTVICMALMSLCILVVVRAGHDLCRAIRQETVPSVLRIQCVRQPQNVLQ